MTITENRVSISVMPTGVYDRTLKSYDRSCKGCGNKFVTNFGMQRYCTLKCRTKSKYRRIWGGPRSDAAKPNRYGECVRLGAANELIVSAHLMKEPIGLHVFRCHSPASPYDLIACELDGPMWRIQVKTGFYNVAKTQVAFGGNREALPPGTDIVAVVTPDNISHYYPAAASQSNQRFAVDKSVRFWENG